MDDKKTSEPKGIVWTKDHEKILIDWGDKAMCYRRLHAKSHNIYNRINAYFTIPVIIMSTLTGTANFAQDRVPEAYRGYYSMGIGFVNILAGIITTIQQFLKISELNEAHRVSSISWDKFYRKIRVELSKPYEERQVVYDFLKSCTEEFDRLMETSPNIDKNVIQLFEQTFNHPNIYDNKRKMFEQLKKPEICDSLESVSVSLFQEDITEKKHTDFKKMIQDVVVHVKESNQEATKEIKIKLIEEFVDNFNREMMRNPTKREILNNLQIEGAVSIDELLVDEYISKNFPPQIQNEENMV